MAWHEGVDGAELVVGHCMNIDAVMECEGKKMAISSLCVSIELCKWRCIWCRQ